MRWSRRAVLCLRARRLWVGRCPARLEALVRSGSSRPDYNTVSGWAMAVLRSSIFSSRCEGKNGGMEWRTWQRLQMESVKTVAPEERHQWQPNNPPNSPSASTHHFQPPQTQPYWKMGKTHICVLNSAHSLRCCFLTSWPTETFVFK